MIDSSRKWAYHREVQDVEPDIGDEDYEGLEFSPGHDKIEGLSIGGRPLEVVVVQRYVAGG